jgi:hypothetical protein
MKIGLLSNSFKDVYDLNKFEKSLIKRYKLKKSQEEEERKRLFGDSPIDRKRRLFEITKK